MLLRLWRRQSRYRAIESRGKYEFYYRCCCDPGEPYSEPSRQAAGSDIQGTKTVGVILISENEKDLTSDFLSSGEIDNALIKLKEKEVAEQIRSNKVIEGVLKDICGELGYLREAIDLNKN